MFPKVWQWNKKGLVGSCVLWWPQVLGFQKIVVFHHHEMSNVANSWRGILDISVHRVFILSWTPICLHIMWENVQFSQSFLLMITICAYRRGCVSADFRHAPWDAKALAGCQWQVKVLRCFTRILAWVWRPNISPSETPFPQLHGRFLFDPSTEKQLD